MAKLAQSVSPRGRPARERALEEFQHTLALVVQPESLYACVLRSIEELLGCNGIALLPVAAQARLRNVHVARELGGLPSVPGDESQLKQLFLNLFMNAFEAMPQGGERRRGRG